VLRWPPNRSTRCRETRGAMENEGTQHSIRGEISIVGPSLSRHDLQSDSTRISSMGVPVAFGVSKPRSSPMVGVISRMVLGSFDTNPRLVSGPTASIITVRQPSQSQPWPVQSSVCLPWSLVTTRVVLPAYTGSDSMKSHTMPTMLSAISIARV